MPQKIPKQAETEILERLSAQMQVSSEEIAEILKRHNVSGSPEALQTRYRKRLGQRLMAKLRDEDGQREVLAVCDGKGGMEYVVIDFCNDPQKLRVLERRLSGQMNGLDESSRKVLERIRRLDSFAQKVRKVG